LNALLAIAWTAVTGQATPVNFLFGFLLGYFVLWLTWQETAPSSYFGKGPRVIGFVLFFIRELIVANLRVAYEVLTPWFTARPAIVAVPLEPQSDLEITLLALMLTLMPGSLSLDVSSDKKTLYVHNMFVSDPDSYRQEVKQNFERRVRRLFE
jgi:multicomponent Na+:H+ antiporter subunit E